MFVNWMVRPYISLAMIAIARLNDDLYHPLEQWPYVRGKAGVSDGESG